MNASLIEQLLWQNESEYLDFKQEQYRFYGASPQEKGELLKDILALANAWRQGDAYILIGVAEIRGGRANVLGVTEHLNDSDLQQFVNSKTQRPVAFSYAAVMFEGVEIGVIRVPQQARPVYLRENYGTLQANLVYVRRGSATDVATPDEIARMGASLVLPEPPALAVEFLDTRTKKSSGTETEISSNIVQTPRGEEIPSYGAGSLFEAPFVNANYYRELAHYVRRTSFLQPLSFLVTNRSGTLATNVRAVFELAHRPGLEVHDSSAHPYTRPRPKSILLASDRLAHLVQMRPGGQHRGIDVEVEDDKWVVTAEFGSVQPKAGVRSSEVFYVGASTPMQVMLRGTVFADNLPQPTEVSLVITIGVTEDRLTVDDLIRLANELATRED